MTPAGGAEQKRTAGDVDHADVDHRVCAVAVAGDEVLADHGEVEDRERGGIVVLDLVDRGECDDVDIHERGHLLEILVAAPRLQVVGGNGTDGPNPGPAGERLRDDPDETLLRVWVERLSSSGHKRHPDLEWQMEPGLTAMTDGAMGSEVLEQSAAPMDVSRRIRDAATDQGHERKQQRVNPRCTHRHHLPLAESNVCNCDGRGAVCGLWSAAGNVWVLVTTGAQ